MPSAWEKISPGLLTDSDIHAVAGEGALITRGFSPAAVKQCCYEFHIGKQITDLALPEAERSRDLAAGDSFIVRPRSTVVIMVDEEIVVPHDGLVRFLLKGKYFSVGLVPVNTYADPGFRGTIGLVVTNVSTNYLRFKQGDVIAKAAFEKLHSKVTVPYHGQHGNATGIWPIPVSYIATQEQLSKANIRASSIAEIRRIHGPEIGEIANRLNYYSRVMWLQLLAVVVFLFLALWIADEVGAAWGIAIGVVSNVLTSLAIAFGHRFVPRWLRDMLAASPR